MLDPEFFETATKPISELILVAENWVLQDIARRIAKTGRITAAAEYQLLRLAETRGFNADYRKKIAELTENTVEAIDRLYREAAELSYNYDKELFTKLDMAWIPFKENTFWQDTIPAIIKQTQGEVRNLTQTTALKMISPVNTLPVQLPKFFEQTLDKNFMNVAMSVESYDDAIKRTIKDMCANGITVVRYEGEGKRPVNRSIEAVVRATVLTGVGQLTDKVTISNMKTLGSTHLLMSWHNGARTGGKNPWSDHSLWQGRVFEVSEETKNKMYGAI